jgi:hypothetical protein
LTASYVRRSEDGNDLVFTVRIGNAGAAPAGEGAPISVYNGDPALSFPFLATLETTERLLPGEYEDVEYRVSSFVSAEESLHFRVEEEGCQTANDVHDSGYFLNRAPSLEVSGDPYAVFPNPQSTVSATVTDDGLPLLGNLTLTWGGTGSNSIPIQFDDPHALTTVAHFSAGGSNFIGAQVSDGALLASDSFFVQVDGPNVPPTVNAGADVVVELPSTSASLDGFVSDDGQPSNQSLTTTWYQVSGPFAASFQNPHAASTLATVSQAGEYVFELVASDGVSTVSDRVTVRVVPPNQAPSVSAGADETIFTPSTLLKGIVTDDGLPLGSSVSSSWSLSSGPGVAVFTNPASPQTAVQFFASGVYVLRLTANDTSLSASDEVTVTVEVTNAPPLVNAGADVTLLLPATSTILSGTVADDGLPAGSIVSVVWNQLSGPAPVSFFDPFALSTQATFPQAGTYVVSLLASDTDLEASDALVVVVDDGNTAPSVDAGADQSVTLPANQVTLTASSADDGLPAGSVLFYTWSRVSGPGLVGFSAPNALSTTASFESAGDYVLRFTASDGLLSSSDTVSVTVEPAPPSGAPPTVEIVTPTERQGVTDFTDVVGTIASDALLSWTLDVGTSRIASGTTPVANAVLGTLDPTLLLNGLHEIRLTAKDTAGRTSVDSVFVVVKENLKVGHFTVSFVDLEVPVSGLPIRVTRTYDSRDKSFGDFGFGWRMDLSSIEVQENSVLGLSWFGQRTFGGLGSYCVTAAKPGVVTVSMPDGEVFEFEPQFSPSCQLVPPSEGVMTFRALPGTNATLAPADGSFVYVVGSFSPPTEPPSPMSLYDASFRLYDPKCTG